MAIQEVRFNPNPQTLQYTGAARVYWKQFWADAWVESPYLEVDEINWQVAPSLPTASLTWHYGRIARPGFFGTFEKVTRLTDRQRWYLKIEADLEYVDNSWITKTWYGVLDIVEDQIGGTIVVPDGLGGQILIPRGEQLLSAYGLEWLLRNHFVSTAVWTPDGAQTKTAARGLTFNHQGLPNRHVQKVQGDWHFASTRSDARYWTTSQIVEYLLKWQTPHPDNSPIAKPKFVLELDDLRNLPDWDQPQLESDGLSTYDLLCQLIPRQRLLGWYLEVETADPDNPFPADIFLRTFTYTSEQITVTDAAGSSSSSIPANEHQLHLIFDTDPTAKLALRDDSVDSVDQVVFRGARRRSVCTIAYSDGLDKGWSEDLETEYEEGASTAPDYPDAAEVKDRQERNQETRSSDHLHAVFRRYVLTEDWTGMAGGQPVFPQHDPLSVDPTADIVTNGPALVYPLELTLSPTLPLLRGVDYTGDKIAERTVSETTAQADRAQVPTLVAWKIPGSDPVRYVNVEELGHNAALEKATDQEQHTWSGHVRVVDGAPAIEIQVQGAAQHVLASTDFDPLDEDEVEGPQPAHDWRNMLVTICVLDDRHCQGVFPAAPEPARNGDALRVLVLEAGDAYRQDYVTVDTVVSIEPTTGELQRSTGGYVRNDTLLLTSAAKVTYQWYRQARRVLSAATLCAVDLDLGAMIVQINDPADPTNVLEVNTPITSMRLLVPRGSSDAPPSPPRMVYTTAAGELDPLNTIGRQSVRVVNQVAQVAPATLPAATPIDPSRIGLFPSGL
jgi:hypothetical protein